MKSRQLLYFHLRVLMPAQRAYDCWMLAVVNRDGVSQVVSKSYAVPTVQLEFSAFEGFDDLFEVL